MNALRSLRRIARAAAAAALLSAAGAALAQDAVPIRFPPGASAAVVEGAAERGGQAIYSFGARAGQRMTLRVEAVEHNAALQVYRPGATLTPDGPEGPVTGATLPGTEPGRDASGWSGRLPETGTYLVVVGPTRGGTSFRLHLAIR